MNRGAIAWDDAGNIRFARLGWQERLLTSDRQPLNILQVNSGYVQAGVARYTPAWGANYQTLTDNEVIVVVRGDRVVNQYQAAAAQSQQFPIPRDGYLLVIRSRGASPQVLAPGTTLSLETQLTPAEFTDFPHIVGAGPLLVQNRQIVLNPRTEGFSTAFERQAAPRSIIGRRADGTLVLAAFHGNGESRGPTLAQTAQMLQSLGFTEALNLDGGSSTSLFLGDDLIDRDKSTAARVHNGIGLYLSPSSLPGTN
ncbi:MAG: phosphodiester glycosidase family protein [Spirulinaceae cyanobacterium SM2_1_0]|nr:phosphodiester glycosidase family protein [Spirulinaceae cyanobacterium SM2_1_0]